MSEAIIESDLPIIDPHHHLWDWRSRLPYLPAEMTHPFEAILRQSPRYLLDELLARKPTGTAPLHRVGHQGHAHRRQMREQGKHQERGCLRKVERPRIHARFDGQEDRRQKKRRESGPDE